MGLTLARCPACGSDLNLETDRDYFYCPHCGSKVLKHDEKIVIEHVVRTIDEAEIKKAEADVEAVKNDAERLKLIRPLMAFMLITFGIIVLMILISRL